MMNQFLPELTAYIQSINPSSISSSRQTELNVLVDYITNKVLENKEINLNFICTHNSRRSQFAQVWAKVASAHYGIEISSYSGGVEVTACNERTIRALEADGFRVTSEGTVNPKYMVYFDQSSSIQLFSKLFDDSANKADEFAAIMTCGHADENCPFIPGTEQRISLRYEDPKAFDNTPLEGEKYRERSNQIATEMFYVFKQVNDGTHAS